MSEKSAFDTMMDDAQTPAPSPATDDKGQPRDDQGKFAKAPEPQPAAAATPPAPTPTPPAPTPEPKHEAIPLPTALEWRDRMTAAERRLKEIEQQRKEQELPAPQIPSVTEDPEGFAAHMADVANRVALNKGFEISEVMAVKEHGADAVKAAKDWALVKAEEEKNRLGFSPFAAEYMRQLHPIDWAIKQQKRDALLAQIGDDPEAYIVAEIAKRTAAGASPEPQPSSAAPQPSAAQPAPKAAPRSIASTPSAGSQHSVPTGPGNAFEAAFPN
jgi:hypothetical protein